MKLNKLLFCVFTFLFFIITESNASKKNKNSKDWSISFSKKQLELKGKKGIGLTMRSPEDAKKRKKSKVSWLDNGPKVESLDVSWNYSWGNTIAPTQPNDVEFTPMSWGGGGLKNIDLKKKFSAQIKSGKFKRYLGFNEPDKKEQSNMHFMKAIELWPMLMELGIPLCSPSCANPEGINDNSVQGVAGTWMKDFMKEADKRNYRVDYIGVHWYGGSNVKNFKDKMKRIYKKYGSRPLLVTEFAPADWKAKTPNKNRISPKKVLTFMKDVLPWMEEQDWILGYAWFPFGIDTPQGTSSALFRKDGSLTACGEYYKSITPDNPKGNQSIKADPPHCK